MKSLYFAPATKTNPVNVPPKIKRRVSRTWSPHESSIKEWYPYKNLKATVLTPVCSSSKIGLPLRYDLVPIWGLSPNAAKDSWDRITEGDFVIFYTGNGNFPYIARVMEKSIDKKLSKTLWPFYELATQRSGNATDQCWSHLLYLDVVWHASIKDSWIQHIRNSNDITIRRFSGVPSHRLGRLPSSPEAIVEEATGQIKSVAVRRERNKTDELNRAMRKGADNRELLSIVFKKSDIDIQQLSVKAKNDILSCIKTLYPEW